MGTFVGAGTFTEKGASGTTLALPLHASAAAGDICVAMYGANSATVIGTQSSPAFTTILSHSSTADTLVPGAWIGYRTLTSGDISTGSVTLNNLPSAAGSGQAVAIRDFTTVQDFTAVYQDKTSTGSGSFPFGAQTITMAGSIGIYVVIQNSATGGTTPASGYTEDGDRVSGRNVETAHQIYNSTGSTGAITPVMAASTRGVGLLIALRPVNQGTFASTLGAVTQSASGTETMSGTFASTLDGTTLAATGTVTSSGVTGTFASTLDGTTLAATGTETISGTAAATLGAVVLAASGTETESGTFATTLGPVTLTASSTETMSGPFASTLGAVVLAASGTSLAGITGTFASTLGAVTQAATGTETIPGTFATTLGSVTLAASGTETESGTLTVTLGSVVLAGSGAETFTGTIAVTLGPVTLTAIGQGRPPRIVHPTGTRNPPNPYSDTTTGTPYGSTADGNPDSTTADGNPYATTGTPNPYGG